MLLPVKDPRTLTRFSLIALALFGILGMVDAAGGFGEGILDGVRGALIGAAIAFLFLASRAHRRRQ